MINAAFSKFLLEYLEVNFPSCEDVTAVVMDETEKNQTGYGLRFKPV